MTKKALIVFSGGLDSILVVEILKRQGFEITALTFVTPFFDAEKAKKSCQKLGIKHIIQEITTEHLKIVKNPSHGYGKNMNPCIDCHSLMFRLAKEILQKKDFDLLATGEVLGQRPFSQKRQALKLIAKISGLENQILRPLSAQKLPETDYEKKGIVEREQLFGFEGKSRKPQLELAQKWEIDYYPNPAGGCLLTDPGFSQRLKDLFQHNSQVEEIEINLLKAGRQFWVKENKVVISRDQEDNQQLREFFDEQKMIMLKLKNYPGPLGVIFINNEKILNKSLKFAAEKIKYYSLKTRNLDEVFLRYRGVEEGEIKV